MIETARFEVVREDVEVRTEDGIALRATVAEPRNTPPRAVAVFAHSMFGRRSLFEKPHADENWLQSFAGAGVRAISFDFRGHGDSGTPASKGGFWAYDDLVQRDLPAVVSAAKSRADGAPVVVVGHSLGGGIALAAQAAARIEADALVLIATLIGLPSWDPSAARRAVRYGLVDMFRRTTARVGYFPARKLRQGSDDESAPFVHDVVRFLVDDAWKSGDGTIDYRARLKHVLVPVLALASKSDRLYAPPECTKTMLREVGGSVEMRIVSEGDDGTPPPSHTELVSGKRSRCVRQSVLHWVLDRATKR
jgi:predicted alpha/beta hydrolase